MPSERDTTSFPSAQNGPRALLSPLTSIGMLLLAAGLSENGPIAIFAGSCLILFYFISEYFFGDLDEDTAISMNAATSFELMGVDTLGDKDSLAIQGSVQNEDIEPPHNRLESGNYPPAKSWFGACYKNVTRYWTICYSTACLLLVDSYIYMITNHLPWNSSNSLRVISTIIVGILSACANCCSLALPTIIRRWLAPGGCLFSLIGVLVWMLDAPVHITIGPSSRDAFSHAAQLFGYMGFILCGVCVFKAPTHSSYHLKSRWKWQAIGQAILFIASCFPGIVGYYSPSSNLARILCAMPETLGTTLARICCILGLMGTGMALTAALYRPNGFSLYSTTQITLLPWLPVVVFPITTIVNLWVPTVLPVLTHYIVLIAGGVLAPLILFVAPLLFYNHSSVPKIRRCIGHLLAFSTAALFVCSTAIALLGTRVTSELSVKPDDINALNNTLPEVFSDNNLGHTQRQWTDPMFSTQDSLYGSDLPPSSSWHSPVCDVELPWLSRRCQRSLSPFTLFTPCQFVHYSFRDIALVFKHPTEGFLALVDKPEPPVTSKCPKTLLKAGHLESNPFNQVAGIGLIEGLRSFLLITVNLEETLSALLANHVTVTDYKHRENSMEELALCTVEYRSDNEFTIYSSQNRSSLNIYQAKRRKDGLFALSLVQPEQYAACISELRANIENCLDLNSQLTNICRAYRNPDTTVTILYKPLHSHWMYIQVPNSYLKRPQNDKIRESCESPLKSGTLKTVPAFANFKQLRQLYKDVYAENEQGRPLSDNSACTFRNGDGLDANMIGTIKYGERYFFLIQDGKGICIRGQY